MNVGVLVDQFDRLGDPPAAVPVLRKFILDLAVRGMLAEQAPEDEPAQELITRLEVHATSQYASLLPRAGSQAPPFGLPPTWAWAPLRTLFEYDASIKREPNQLKGDWWLLDLEDIEKDSGRLLSRRLVRETPPKSTKSEFAPGDILYGKLRPYLNKAIVADRPGYSTTEIVALRPRVPMCSEYWSIVLRQSRFSQHVTELGRGTKMPRLRTDDALQATLPVPPVAEQARIVAKVEEMEVLCDQLEVAQAGREQRRRGLRIASLTRLVASAEAGVEVGKGQEAAHFYLKHSDRMVTAPDHLADVRAAILDLAVTGRLSSGRSIAWEKTTLGAMSEWITSGSRGWAAYYAKSGAAFLRAQNVRFGRLSLGDLGHVNPPAGAEGVRTRIAVNDIVVVITGAGVTNPALVDLDLGEAYVSQHLALARPVRTEQARWILLWLLAQAGGRNALVDRAYGAGRPGLNLDNLRSLPIAVPPVDEQRRAVAKVDELLGACNQLESALTTGETGRVKLLEAALEEALGRRLD